MRTLEGNSPDWSKARVRIEKDGLSYRAVAKELGVSDTAVRKQASKGGWQRLSVPAALREPKSEPVREPRATRSEATAKSISTATVQQLTARGRNIILALMDELEFLNANADTLSEIVEDHFNGEKDDRTRFKLQKALDHETRSKTANYLATALAKLNDAAPGKKEQAQADAETAGKESGWGDDLETGVTGRPN